ncbi:MAG: hypothetical protein Tsb004_30410 [Allomuricauda sp.]
MTYKNPQQIAYIYNASGLVAEVLKNGEPLVKFFYNDRNHRVKKEHYAPNNFLFATTYYVRDVAGQVMAVYNDVGGDPALEEQPVYGTGRIGVAYNGNNNEKTYVYELTDHLGNVRAVFTKSNDDANLEGYTDYYPFGMPMPNRTLSGAEGYRYAFQGQEKDDETGKEAFQLRLWDSRIGRWLTTDPYGQHHSPYLGMGNDPINSIDPDGGWKWKLFAKWARNRAAKAGLNPGELYKSGKEWGFNTSSGGETFNFQNGGGLEYSTTVTFNFTDAWKNNIPAQIRPTSALTNFQFWRNEAPTGGFDLLKHTGAELTFGTADNLNILFTGRHIGGASPRGYNSRIDASMDGLLTIATAGGSKLFKGTLTTLKSSVPLWQNFAKNTAGLFKGANHATLRSRAYTEMIKNHYQLYKSNKQMLKDIDKFNDDFNRINTMYLETQKE